MYVLLGVLLLSRFFTRTWTEKIAANRHCAGEVFEIGETAEVTVEIENHGPLSIPWLMLKTRCRAKPWRKCPIGSRWKADD